MDNLESIIGNKNGHRFADREQGIRMEWLNAEVGYTNYGKDAKVVSYGMN